MLEIKVEGIYESDIGSGQKKYESFSYTFKTSRRSEKGVDTHVLRRFIPLLIAKDKNKRNTIYSRLRSFVITDIQKVEDTKECIINKDINTLDDWQIQDLACTFDLYEVPIANRYPIITMREMATLAYLKKVYKIPMKTSKDKEKLSFMEKQPDGSYKLNLGNQVVLAQIPTGYFEEKKKEEPKKDLSYFIKNAGQNLANGILAATGNTPTLNDNPEIQNNNPNPFPSQQDLIGNQNVLLPPQNN